MLEQGECWSRKNVEAERMVETERAFECKILFYAKRAQRATPRWCSSGKKGPLRNEVNKGTLAQRLVWYTTAPGHTRTNE